MKHTTKLKTFYSGLLLLLFFSFNAGATHPITLNETSPASKDENYKLDKSKQHKSILDRVSFRVYRKLQRIKQALKPYFTDPMNKELYFSLFYGILGGVFLAIGFYLLTNQVSFLNFQRAALTVILLSIFMFIMSSINFLIWVINI